MNPATDKTPSPRDMVMKDGPLQGMLISASLFVKQIDRYMIAWRPPSKFEMTPYAVPHDEPCQIKQLLYTADGMFDREGRTDDLLYIIWTARDNADKDKPSEQKP